MAQVGPFCRTCQWEKTTNWKCMTCDIIMCESCNENHLQMHQGHQSTNTSENTNLNNHLIEEIDDTIFTQIKCKYHVDYNCTDVCLSCLKVICAKCRYEKHADRHHQLELIETFYQHKRKMLLKCKSIIQNDSLPKANKGVSFMENAEVCHSKHFEKEKQKVLKQTEALKRRITERSNKKVEQLEENFQMYKSTTQNKHEQQRMEQNLREIEYLEQNFMEKILTQNSELGRALGEVNRIMYNIRNNTTQWDIPTLIPRSVKKFIPKEIHDEDIDIALGDLVDCSILDEVPIRKVNSYDINFNFSCGMCRSLEVNKDGAIWVSDTFGLLQVKTISNGKQNTHQPINNIYDISFLESKGLLIVYKDKNVIDIQNNLGLCEKFYEKPNGRLNAVALHVCRDDRIIILTWSKYFFLPGLGTLDIIELTNCGKLINTIRCKGGSYLFPEFGEVFRISENINGHFCVSCEFDCQVVDFNNNGDKMWIYSDCKRPSGILTTKLGNIVIIDAHEFIKILNADGKCLTNLNIKEHGPIGYLSALRLISEKELLILSTDKLTVLEFSTII